MTTKINGLSLGDLRDIFEAAGAPAAAADALVAQVTPKPTYTPEARILVITTTTCKCGEVYQCPGATDLLVRYRKGGALHEVSNDDARHNPSLPIIERHLHKQVHLCKKCAGQEDLQFQLFH